MVARAASLYTDPFILMSGLLTTMSFLKHLDRNGKIDLPKEFASRFVRYVTVCTAYLYLYCCSLDIISGSIYRQGGDGVRVKNYTFAP